MENKKISLESDKNKNIKEKINNIIKNSIELSSNKNDKNIKKEESSSNTNTEQNMIMQI